VPKRGFKWNFNRVVRPGQAAVAQDWSWDFAEALVGLHPWASLRDFVGSLQGCLKILGQTHLKYRRAER
jgi:hypothetical protein